MIPFIFAGLGIGAALLANEEIREGARDKIEEGWDKIRDRIGDATMDFEDKYLSTIYPIRGSIVYCKLPFAEHSGVYVGENQIAHLEGNGRIALVSPREFINRLGGWNIALQIYVSCSNGRSVGKEIVCRRALEKAGKSRNYNMLFDNCHQFTAGCLTGDFNNPINFFWMLKGEVEKRLGADHWRAWTLDPDEIF